MASDNAASADGVWGVQVPGRYSMDSAGVLVWPPEYKNLEIPTATKNNQDVGRW